MISNNDISKLQSQRQELHVQTKLPLHFPDRNFF